MVVAKDEKAAVEWYQKAASKGCRWAEYNLGACFEKGVGVDRDRDTAVCWYERSAAKGYDEAISALQRLRTSVSGVWSANP